MGSTQTYVSNLRSTAEQLNSQMNAELKRVDTAVNEIEVSANKIYRKITDFHKTMCQGEEKQLAHENTIRIEQQLEEKLKHYIAVRRVVMGVVHDFDINLVRNKTINELSEELWMSSSRYWLSYALIAISAWTLDNKELADSALSMGMRQDPVRLSLFFTLFSLHFGRNGTAKQWLSVYFEQVDPCAPSREMAILLQAYLCGVFGEDSTLEYIVKTRVDSWKIALRENVESQEDISGKYYEYIAGKKGQDAFKSEMLEEYCSNMGDFKKAYEDVSKFERIQHELDQLIGAKSDSSKKNMRQLIDDMMEKLINQPDDEEQAALDEKKYYEFVMESDGDVAAAEKLYKAYRGVREQDPNIGRTMLNWVLYASPAEAPYDVKRFSLAHTKEWFSQAVEQYGSNLALNRPTSFQVSIDVWTDSVTGKNREQAEHALEESIKSNKLHTAVFNPANIVLTIIAIIAAIVAIPVITANTLAGIILFCVAAVMLAVVGIIIGTRFAKFPRRIAKAKKLLNGCFDEMERYNKEYDAYAEKGVELASFLYNFSI